MYLTAVLALTAGQAVANINLATLDPSTRSEIRESSSLLDKKREEVSYQRLRYELERVYTYLEGELGNPSSKGYIPLQDRLNVAEFGLLESQLEGFERLLQAGESVLDADVLAVVSDQMTDFKRRLGIDYYVTGVTFDQEAIRRWLQDLFQQIKRGVAFYVKGCELFWNDIVYALTLIGRALQGYTLKPREVRNLRCVLRLFGFLVSSFEVDSKSKNFYTLSCARQANVQGYRHLYSCRNNLDNTPHSRWARHGLWRHSKILSRFLSK